MNAPRAGSGASDAFIGPVVPVRGRRHAAARYLLRNGLDYLQYQQYERALKFLRDAEGREKELSATERQQLKRGIEQAQGGLRAAADAAVPYAIGLNSRLAAPEWIHRRPCRNPRPSSPIGPARPARRAAPRRVPAARAVPARGRSRLVGAAVTVAAASSGAGRITADDTPGEPIRLTSIEGDAGSPSPAAGQLPASEVPVSSTEPPVDIQSARAEIPTLNAPNIPTLNAVPSSPDATAVASAAAVGRRGRARDATG